MKWCYVILILFSPCNMSTLSDLNSSEFIIWNVGQGQWTTWVQTSTCFHFDIGGEKFPLQEISWRCRNKRNELFLSHWDWDHLSGLKKIKAWKNFCLRAIPALSSDRKKTLLIQSFSSCSGRGSNEIQKIYGGFEEAKANAQSQVFLAGNILLSGDSLNEQEKIWSSRLSGKKIEGFVLGHHGSKSSN